MGKQLESPSAVDPGLFRLRDTAEFNSHFSRFPGLVIKRLRMQAESSPIKRRRNFEMLEEVDDLSDVDETSAPVQRDFYSNFSLLTFLYMLQGIPLGLAGGTVPYLLKANGASYTSVGIFR